jgi:hypothetical protein
VGHAGGEVAWRDRVDADVEPPARKLSCKLVGKRNCGSSAERLRRVSNVVQENGALDQKGYSLGRVVVELALLRSFGNAGHGRDIQDISGFGKTADAFGCVKEREESERGEMIRDRVDSVSVKPEMLPVVKRASLPSARRHKN